MLRAAMVPTVAQLIKKLFDTDQGFTATLRAIAEGEGRHSSGKQPRGRSRVVSRPEKARKCQGSVQLKRPEDGEHQHFG